MGGLTVESEGVDSGFYTGFCVLSLAVGSRDERFERRRADLRAVLAVLAVDIWRFLT